ncbi:uncharacterized protein PV09_05592 [Verruconis gallopava]|uniref:Uncharacterized protein n=1 Tax=Verruconis gallopava TaxID=253628 RepID=A0A0D2A9V0_9PEZI|nr:uncharacterized protein PV09_05592 [Verruconis gallopava]KIW03385.1 hypothetical protein PV09_05592 [Verruconis gallopava]
MLAHSLLSGALLLLPIAVTVGIYIGVEFQKIFHDGFKGSYGIPTGSGGGSATPGSSGGVETNMYCQKLIGITPQGSRYTYNPNQWGLGANDPSGLCMNITTGTLAKNSKYADPFSVTWNYTQGPETQPVHAFPNALLEADNLPTTISSVSSIPVDVSWTYGIGNSNETNTATADLDAADLNANVAVDMFLDTDKSTSSETTKAAHEVMVWLGQFGPATQPIGYSAGAVVTKSINGTTFNLYTGTNGNGQHVWTWVATTTTNRFVGDISPLITELSAQSGPTGTDYLGYIGFGSEAYWSPQNVTFSVPELYIDVL